eukprot:4078306-Amphidinium_carterae.1
MKHILEQHDLLPAAMDDDEQKEDDEDNDEEEESMNVDGAQQEVVDWSAGIGMIKTRLTYTCCVSAPGLMCFTGTGMIRTRVTYICC